MASAGIWGRVLREAEALGIPPGKLWSRVYGTARRYFERRKRERRRLSRNGPVAAYGMDGPEAGPP